MNDDLYPTSHALHRCVRRGGAAGRRELPQCSVGPPQTADDIVTRKLDLGSGRIDVPGGLGVELSKEKLQRYLVTV